MAKKTKLSEYLEVNNIPEKSVQGLLLKDFYEYCKIKKPTNKNVENDLVEPKTEPEPKISTPKEPTLEVKMVELFCKWHDYIKPTPYVVNWGKEINIMRAIIRAMRELLSKTTNQDSKLITDIDIQENFKIILKSVKNDWVLKNFSIATISHSFNSIISEVAANNTTFKRQNKQF